MALGTGCCLSPNLKHRENAFGNYSSATINLDILVQIDTGNMGLMNKYIVSEQRMKISQKCCTHTPLVRVALLRDGFGSDTSFLIFSKDKENPDLC